MSNSYRNPRFMPDHVYRSENTDITLVGSTETATLPRLIDDQNKRAWVSGNGNQTNIDFDRAGSVTQPIHEPIDRIIIGGSNLAANRTQVEVLFDEDGVDPYTLRTLIDGSQIGYAIPFGPADFQVQREPNPTGYPQFEQVSIETGLSDHEIGEVYASRQLTTSSGLVFDWTDSEAPNTVIAETFAHLVFSLERGDARRVWRLRYQGINDEDMSTLDEVRRLVGLQVHPFWFDPPASGAVFDVDGTWSPLGSWVANPNITMTFPATGSPNGGPTVLATNNNPASSHVFQENLAAPIDLHGKLLQFDMRQRPGAWAALPESLSLVLESPDGGLSQYALGDVWNNMTGVQSAAYQRFQIDPETSPVVALSDTTVDLGSVSVIGFRIVNVLADEGTEVGNLTIVEKSETVQYVELMSFTKRQQSSSPKFRLAWDVDMLIREVLS